MYRPVIICLGVFCIFIYVCEGQMLNKMAYATVPQLITSAGYPVQRYRVKTEDGYSLQLHRIPAGRRSARWTGSTGAETAKGKRAVLVLHGLLGSSGDFIIMGPERGLGYMLADAGYDVWLANLRGTTYSSHQKYTRSDPKFWNFSFHEHGKYDVPAIIDKVLNVTQLPKILFIGYSMGATSFFTMICQKPEYNDKLVAFVGLAPAVYMDNIRQLAEFGLKAMNFPNSMRLRGVHSFNIPSEILDMLAGGVCSVKQPQQDMCMRVIYSFVGEDYEQNDWDMSPIWIARFQPASWKQIEHFGKLALTSDFTQWSKGLWASSKPYNLNNVRVPVLLLYGENDKLTEKHQILRLAQVLNKTGTLYDVKPGTNWPKFNHLDFVFAKDVGKLLNKPLIKDVNILYEKFGAL